MIRFLALGLPVAGVVLGAGSRVIVRSRAAESLTDADGVALLDGAGNPLEAGPEAEPANPAGDLSLYPNVPPVETLVDQLGNPLTDARGQPLWALDLAPYDTEPA